MGQSLSDLLPRTRQLLALMVDLVSQRDGEMLTQREMRGIFGWGDYALRRHLKRLVELECVLVFRGPGNQRQYKLIYDGQNAPFVLGLSDLSGA
jgi:hypothetical protein